MTNPFDMPNAMRDMAIKSMEQARKAFDDYMSAAQKAASEMQGSGAAVQGGAKRLQEETVAFAEANVTASLELVQSLMRARDLHEVVRIQQDYLEQQMAAFADQSKRVAEIAAGSDPGKRR